MASETVRIVARITGRAETAEALESVLTALVGATRAEPGCLSYELCRSRSDPAEFVFVEEWTNDAAVDAHMTTAHVQDAFSKAQSLLGMPPDIRKYSLIC